MVRVLVDFEALQPTSHEQPDERQAELCRQLGQALLAAKDPRIELRFLLPDPPPAELRHVSTTIAASRWRRESAPRLARPSASQAGFALWHALHEETQHLPRDPSVPFVLTIHDLSFMRGQEPARAMLWRLGKLQRKVDRATRIATTSEQVAADIREYLDLRGKRVEVIGGGEGAPDEAAWLAMARQYLDLYQRLLGVAPVQRAA